MRGEHDGTADYTPAAGHWFEGEIDRPALSRRRSSGIWVLTFVNLLLATLSFLGTRFLAGAEQYLMNDSTEFGHGLDAALAGIWVLRILFFVWLGGFLASALGVISLTRLGWRVQFIWALVLGLTVVGMLYTLPVIVFIQRSETRERFFPSTFFIE